MRALLHSGHDAVWTLKLTTRVEVQDELASMIFQASSVELSSSRFLVWARFFWPKGEFDEKCGSISPLGQNVAL
jgi:hypothetical protein